MISHTVVFISLKLHKITIIQLMTTPSYQIHLCYVNLIANNCTTI